MDTERLNPHEEEAVRTQKLARMKAAGFDPFTADVVRTHTIHQVLGGFDALVASAAPVSIVGRIKTRRTHGGMTFLDIEDGSAQMQVALKLDHVGADTYAQFNDLMDSGDFVQITGTCFVTKRGEKTVDCSSWKVLTKALLPLPEKWHGLTDVETRYRKRYLDLLSNKEVRHVFAMRSLIVKKIREVMDRYHFMEVETPILQSVAGGASARPFVTHHNALDIDLFLRIAPELYLKRLIVGGFERVYEIARCFRNEGISFQHNPEFTQIEFYWAYATYEDLMKLTEEMLAEIVASVTGGKHEIERDGVVLNFQAPFPRLKFFDIVREKTGIDLETVSTEQHLRDEIIKRKLKLDMKDVVGYGELCDALYKEHVRPSIVQPTFVIDYPVEMIPLAKRKAAEPRKIATMQLLVQGMELTKAYNELNDPLDQAERFQEEELKKGKGSEEAMETDADFIEALKHGMPPTAGFGMGIDRLCSVLLGTHSIKEVILFPTMRPEASGHDKAKDKTA